ncbi:LON peptidase substrate-binding domain-containing protein [Pelagibacteraceae bacterium]|nr:LON peptidase substrate-binding domain-containing protein [Pelagibacteraceae bacterium]
MNETFPQLIPVFPLSGVIYFPKTNLPLNIFEKRYLDLINDSLKKDKLLGMVQSKNDGEKVYNIGCLGKINDFQKTADGRIVVNLAGLTRFEIVKEINNTKLYREFEVNYDKFKNDLFSNKPINDEKVKILFNNSKIFLNKYGIILNWKELEKLELNQRINTLAMITPISNEEKQKLLETISLEEKIQTMLDITEFYLHETAFSQNTLQ